MYTAYITLHFTQIISLIPIFDNLKSSLGAREFSVKPRDPAGLLPQDQEARAGTLKIHPKAAAERQHRGKAEPLLPEPLTEHQEPSCPLWAPQAGLEFACPQTPTPALCASHILRTSARSGVCHSTLSLRCPVRYSVNAQSNG